jgi:hypothetical protein
MKELQAIRDRFRRDSLQLQAGATSHWSIPRSFLCMKSCHVRLKSDCKNGSSPTTSYAFWSRLPLVSNNRIIH